MTSAPRHPDPILAAGEALRLFDPPTFATPARELVSPAKISSPGLPPLTTAARRFLLALLVLFLAAVTACFHGSPVNLCVTGDKSDIAPTRRASGLLLSRPKILRADEWNVWTPAVLKVAGAVGRPQ